MFWISLAVVWSRSLTPHSDLSPHSQTPNGLPTVNSYVTAPSIHPYHPPTQVSPYMGYSGTTSAYVTGPTWQPPSGSALSPHSCDITAPLAFKSMAATRDSMDPVTASAVWFRAEGQHMWGRTSRNPLLDGLMSALWHIYERPAWGVQLFPGLNPINSMFASKREGERVSANSVCPWCRGVSS